MPDADTPYVHPDHWSKEHRDLIAHLREQHLPGVDTDDEALIALTIEQARLLLVTAGGLLGLTITTLLDLNRKVCISPIYAEIAALSVALMLGWAGLLLGGKVRAQRVSRRYDIYNAHFDAHMQSWKTGKPVDLTTFDHVFDTAFTPERSTLSVMDVLRWTAAALTSFGICMAAVAAIGTVVPERCLGHDMVGGKSAAVSPSPG